MKKITWMIIMIFEKTKGSKDTKPFYYVRDSSILGFTFGQLHYSRVCNEYVYQPFEDSNPLREAELKELVNMIEQLNKECKKGA